MLPVSATGAIVRVMRAFEDRLRDELAEFSLATSLSDPDAPDLRVIISDGHRIFFSLGHGTRAPKLFGGVSIEELSNDGWAPSGIGIVDGQATGTAFGGPEGSNFARSEISLTAIAKALPIA